MRAVVVYVHGLWFGGEESFLLRRRLARELGAEIRVFRYSSVGADLAHSAAALRAYLSAIAADTVHVVGHSMGGIVILEALGAPLPLPPGRIVLTGSPVRGSLSARRLARLPCGPALLGRTAREVLVEGRERRWSGGRELGVIAGNLAMGLGRLIGLMHLPSDGTVLVEETDLPGATEQMTLPVSHTGLLFSSAVARQTAAFLREGRFIPGPIASSETATRAPPGD